MMSFEREQRFEIPATIHSCNGSLHSESSHKDEPYVDHSEMNLLSETESTHGHDDLISQRDKDFDKKWRGLVAFMLVGNALIITGATYAFLANQEQKDFASTFERYAESIMDACHYHASSVAVTFESVSDSITSFAHDSDSQWPFVTITDFEVHSVHSREASFTELVGFVPLIPNARRMEQWKTYAKDNIGWLTESRLTAAKMDPDSTISSEIAELSSLQPSEAPEEGPGGAQVNNTTSSDRSNRLLQEPEDKEEIKGPFAPVWQVSPPPNSARIIGTDLLKHDTMEKLMFAMYESEHIAISPVMDVAFLTGKDELPNKTAADYDAEFLVMYPGVLNATSPKSVLFQPIYDDHNFHDENPSLPSERLQGLYFGVLSWESYFSELLPDGVNGIFCVVRNDCGQEFTFLINGREAVYLGLGDHHQEKYNGHEVSTPFYEFQEEDAPTNATTSSIPKNKDRFQCHYSLSIYPSSTLQEDQETSRPFFFTMIVGLIFVCTFVVFLVYLKVIEWRTRRVEKVAKASDKILATLYPEEVKRELIKDAQEEASEARNSNTMMGPSGSNARRSNASTMVAEFLSTDEESAFMGQSMGSGGDSTMGLSAVSHRRYKTKPIANLFSDTTIFFADIAGFTKWSSTRTPTEVFELLEAIYGTFDVLAKKRHVYKIETIGDCYVAVTGLPKPNARHALVMVRFAQDCLNHFGKVTKALEESLGEDTSDLSMRIGLHSGPVTAGVLRGERSRFQLFGDTVNTAARMEANGKPRCIHVSEATAELLRGHGRSSWLRKREDLVNAKGKGLMQTYYVVASATAASQMSSKSGSGDDEHGEKSVTSFTATSAKGDSFRNTHLQDTDMSSTFNSTHPSSCGADNQVHNNKEVTKPTRSSWSGRDVEVATETTTDELESFGRDEDDAVGDIVSPRREQDDGIDLVPSEGGGNDSITDLGPGSLLV